MNAKAFLALILVLAAACRSHDEDAPPPSAPASSTKAPAADAPSVPAHQPGAALVFKPQPGWTVETPSSPMRKAQYRLPHLAGDAEDATLVVTFFSGQGGGLEANIERWTSQFEQPDGKKSADLVQRAERKVDGMDVHEVALSGTYVAETSPGSGKQYHNENWRMLAAIVDSDHGPYYLKLVGPAATVSHWESSWRAFVGEIERGK